MAYSVTGRRADRAFTPLRALSPRVGVYLATAHTMPNKRDVLDLSGVTVTQVPGRRAPRAVMYAMHAKGDTTGHTQREVFIALQQRNRNTGAQT